MNQMCNSHSRRAVIAELVLANNRLWSTWLSKEGSVWCNDHDMRVLVDTAFPENAITPELELYRTTLEQRLKGHAKGDKSDSTPFPVEPGILEPDAFTALFLPPEEIRENDRRYFVRAAIRGNISWSAGLRETFRRLTAKMRGGPGERTYSELESTLNKEPLFDRHEEYVRIYLNVLRHLRIRDRAFAQTEHAIPGIRVYDIYSGGNRSSGSWLDQRRSLWRLRARELPLARPSCLGAPGIRTLHSQLGDQVSARAQGCRLGPRRARRLGPARLALILRSPWLRLLHRRPPHSPRLRRLLRQT